MKYWSSISWLSREASDVFVDNVFISMKVENDCMGYWSQKSL